MLSFSNSILLCAPIALALAAPAGADTITGQVVDENGVGVPNVNIDGVDLSTGDDAAITNGSTNAGGFFNATIDPGTYRLNFKPPLPPTTTLLVGVLDPVVVSGVTNLGTIQLELGVSLSGRVVTPGSQPLQNVDIDIIRMLDSSRVELTGDRTDANGDFLIAAPTGAIEVRFDPAPAGGATLAPTFRELDLSANHAMGTIQLEPGFVVTSIVRRPNGSAVSDADLDARDSTSGEKQYTPGDNTDNNGFVDFVLAAGTYDIEVCAPINDRLTTHVVSNVIVNSNHNLGIITMQPGVLLSGHVQSTGGAPIHRVDLDLFPAGGGAEVPTCNDNTDEQGNYAFVVPTGNFDVRFMPELTDPYCFLDVPGVVINNDRTLDATLPDTLGTRRCSANANSTGSPARLMACGSASSSAGDLTLLSVSLPNQPGIFFHGANPINVAFGNGRLCAGGGLRRGTVVSASDNVALYAYDNSNAKRDLSDHIGTTRNFQHWFRDPMGGGARFNTSDSLSIDILP